MKVRHRIKEATLLKFYHCEYCEKDFDVENYEIIFKGDTYRRKKDCIDPFI